jgi:hypothetical protein
MQRPARIFLVKRWMPPNALQPYYYLVWKEGQRLWRMTAGFGPEYLERATVLDTDDAVAPTIHSVVDDLHRDPESPRERVRFEAFDVSDHLGRHYPRVRRGEINGGHLEPQSLSVDVCGLRAALVSSAVAADLLVAELNEICTVVEPVESQLDVFGHRLRHLLIAACTEVESAWRSVLVANSSSPPASPGTNEYVRLAEPMRLRERSVHFMRVEPTRHLEPFATWDSARPTASLPWYAAYNATKHNREMHLNHATLGNVIDALAALHIMLVAQFGRDADPYVASHPFRVMAQLGFDEERYIRSPFDDGEWRETKLFG